VPAGRDRQLLRGRRGIRECDRQSEQAAGGESKRLHGISSLVRTIVNKAPRPSLCE